MTAPEQATQRDVPTMLGLLVIAAGAIVMSFAALADLAWLCGRREMAHVGPAGGDGWDLRVAWLLPTVLDALAAVATRVWLARRAAPEAVRYASRVAWAAVLASVGGGMYHGYLVQESATPPWVVAALVSGVPAVAIGVAVHLAMLLGRPVGETVERQASAPGRLPQWGAAVKAWWIARKALNPKPGEGQAEAGGDQAEDVPTGADSNEVLAADLRRLNTARRADGSPSLSRDAVVARYRIGSTRAQAVRDLAEQPTAPPAKPHLVRDDVSTERPA